MAERKSLKQWIMAQRASTRMAYMLHMTTRLGASAMGLIWTRLLLDAMGNTLMTSYLAFSKLITLGGLGDLGLGGSIAIRTGQSLAPEKEQELKKFLASARAIFLFFALLAGGIFICLTPWLQQRLNFEYDPRLGSVHLLFAVGAVSISMMILYSYMSNLNYGCGNVTWPVLPVFIVLQSTMLAHWLLARAGYPLWVQFVPYVCSSILNSLLLWSYVRISYPNLANIFPLHFDWSLAKTLVESSFWVYLCTLGNAVYRSTDALVIKGSPLNHLLVQYELNYRFCDLAVFVALTASLVALPKITQWMASTDPNDQARVRTEMIRLNQFQSLLGCGAALGYLLGNDLFMKIWMLHKADPVAAAPLLWQTAFALNMTVTTCGDTSIQLSMRSGSRGLRVIGATIGLTALLNLGLSILSMKFGSIAGVAFATVLAQAVLSLGSAVYLCKHLNLPMMKWILRSLVIPILGVGLAAYLRFQFPPDTAASFIMLAGCYALMLVAAAWGLGVRPSLLKEELKILKSFVKK